MIGVKKEEGFSSLLFRWEHDRKQDRLILCNVPDLRGRNVQRFGDSVLHFPRWVELGYELELLRLTDYINSLKRERRRYLCSLKHLSLFRPTEILINDLWGLARGFMSIDQFHKKYMVVV
jgi:hypothetical protein